MRRSTLLALVALGLRDAGAGDPGPAAPDTAEQAAEKVLAACLAGDGAALRALAGRDDPDPWVVADELCARGRFDEAERFAKGAPRPDTEGLPAYAASRRDAGEVPGARSLLAEAAKALAARDAAKVIRDTEGIHPSDVVTTRIVAMRGYALRSVRRLGEAAETLRLAARSAESMGWLAGAAILLHESGVTRHLNAEARIALEEWTRCLGIEERRGDRQGIAAALANCANMRIYLGDLREALDLQERARSVFEEIGDRESASSVLANIGNLHYARKAYAEALSFYEAAFRAKEALGDRPAMAIVLASIVNVLQETGEHENALAAGRDGLRIAEELGLGEVIAGIVATMGRVHHCRGDHALALECYERAMALAEGRDDRRAVAHLRISIGITSYVLGDYEKALSMYERALLLFEALEDPEGVWLALGNLGNVHERLGHAAEALAYQERSLALAEEREDRAGVARALVNIGNILFHSAEYGKALEHQERALALKRQIGDRAGEALVLGNIALTLERLGEVERAVDFKERALALAREIGDARTEVNNLSELAAIHLSASRPAEALGLARDALERLPVLVRGLGDEQGAAARGLHSNLYSTGIRAAARLADAPAVCLFLESGRAGSLLESLGGGDALRTAEIPEGLRRAEAAARAEETRIAEDLGRALEAGDRAACRARKAELESARGRLLDVVSRIQREAKRAASVLYPKARSLEEIRRELREGQALVLYASGIEEPVALVVTPEAARIVPLAREGIADAVEALRPADSGSDPSEAARALSELVIRPLGLAAGTSRLFVSPDGALAQVPFSLLLPGTEIAYVPSGTTYGLLRAEADRRGEGILALGDPDYGTPAAGSELDVFRSGGRFSPLPGSRKEAEAVGSETLLGAAASEANLLAAIGRRERWRAVHLACHGSVDAARPRLSSLALAKGDMLHLLEVFRSRIPADLVVLSACETGRGREYAAEGVIGFTRAFMFAGAPRVIVSLWKVDDDATCALMVKFYELWNPKAGGKALPAATALRRAQEFVAGQEKWRHPRFWAAWQLWGLAD